MAHIVRGGDGDEVLAVGQDTSAGDPVVDTPIWPAGITVVVQMYGIVFSSLPFRISPGFA
jgi:hypothetical protein